MDKRSIIQGISEHLEMKNQHFATQLKELDQTVETPAESTDAAYLLFEEESAANERSFLEEADYSGQLAVDVYQTDNEVIIKSTIGGVQPEDLDISINNDLITIRGTRRQEETIADEQYLYKECHWGGFSRSIILPFEVQEEKVKASLKNGVLTIALPRAGTSRVRVVEVEEEN